MANSIKWRINISANNGGSGARIFEMEMRASLGGPDECNGGIPSASSGNAALAFDNNTSSFWASSPALPGWLAYQFPATKNIVQYAITMQSGQGAFAPKDWTFEYWDGLSWIVADTITGETGWAVGPLETRLFNVPALLHESSLNKMYALNGISLNEASLNKRYALNGVALNESSLNKMYALNGVALNEAVLNQLYDLAGVALLETSLDQLYALTGVALIETSLDQLYALAGVTLIESDFNQMYSTRVSKGEIAHRQNYFLDGDGVPTPELVDVVYTLDLNGTVIPMKSFQGKAKNSGRDYMVLVIPNGYQYVDVFEAAVGDDLIIYRGGKDRSTGEVSQDEMMRVELETVRSDRGAVNATVTLTGHKDAEPVGAATGRILTGVTYEGIFSGKKRYRAEFNSLLRPGDQMEVFSLFLDVGAITYTIDARQSSMEVNEA